MQEFLLKLLDVSHDLFTIFILLICATIIYFIFCVKEIFVSFIERNKPINNYYYGYESADHNDDH